MPQRLNLFSLSHEIFFIPQCSFFSPAQHFPNSYSKTGEDVKLQVTRREQSLINIKYECYLREKRADSTSTGCNVWHGLVIANCKLYKINDS